MLLNLFVCANCLFLFFAFEVTFAPVSSFSIRVQEWLLFLLKTGKHTCEFHWLKTGHASEFHLDGIP
jgi:hypothetical protein